MHSTQYLLSTYTAMMWLTTVTNVCKVYPNRCCMCTQSVQIVSNQSTSTLRSPTMIASVSTNLTNPSSKELLLSARPDHLSKSTVILQFTQLPHSDIPFGSSVLTTKSMANTAFVSSCRIQITYYRSHHGNCHDRYRSKNDH